MSKSNYYLEAIENAKAAEGEGASFTYTERDATLYNISLGATSKQLSLVYEQAQDFQVLPTYGVIVPYTAPRPFNLAEIVPNFSYKMLLHGEQYLEIHQWPIPTSATVVSKQKLLEVIDKGNAAVVTVASTSRDARTGDSLFYNEATLFIRGSGGFGGPRRANADGGRAIAAFDMPNRVPDTVAEEQTSPHQAALYRLNGDRNPLHIDPIVAKAAGFKDGPILHGLCSFGLTAKHVLATYGKFANIKVRFSGTVQPGQTLQVEMWREGTMALFQTRIKETGKLCIGNGGAELISNASKL